MEEEEDSASDLSINFEQDDDLLQVPENFFSLKSDSVTNALMLAEARQSVGAQDVEGRLLIDCERKEPEKTHNNLQRSPIYFLAGANDEGEVEESKHRPVRQEEEKHEQGSMPPPIWGSFGVERRSDDISKNVLIFDSDVFSSTAVACMFQ